MMQDETEIDLKPSRLRTTIWSILMVGIVVGSGIMLWRAYQLRQSAIMEKGERPVVTQKESGSQEEVEGVTRGESGRVGEEEANDEFVARAETSVTFPQPPASLNESDPWLREQLPRVNPDPTFKRWLDLTPDLFRKFVLLTDQISQGRVPRKTFTFWTPKEPFKVTQTPEGKTIVDPTGYHRYDLLAEVVDAFDMELAWRLYQIVRPLVQEAFAEIAPPGKQFDQVLLAATEHLLSTPQPRGDIALVKPSVMYKYADPELEALSAAQKQLLRMGPINATMIKHKLGLLRGYLLKEVNRTADLPPAPLP